MKFLSGQKYAIFWNYCDSIPDNEQKYDDNDTITTTTNVIIITLNTSYYVTAK